MDEAWFPARAKIVVRAVKRDGSRVLEFACHPNYPNAWRREPYYSTIMRAARLGPVVADHVQVRARDNIIFVLPNGEVIQRKQEATAEEQRALGEELDRKFFRKGF
jgi:hypothetical protein